MKRFFASILLCAVLFSFAACQPSTGNPTGQLSTLSQSGTDSSTHSTDTGTSTGTITDQPPKFPFDIVLNEVMPDNEILCLGHDQDWVELFNNGDTEATLEGYYLTDDPAKPERIDLSEKTIPAGGYLVIVLDDNAPFRLSSMGESIYLTYDGEVVSYITFDATDGTVSYSQQGVCPYVTPGFNNTEEGYEAYLKTVKLPDLIINEVMTSNSKYAPFNKKYYDVAEIYNNSDKEINLAEYTFSDKRSEPDRFQFPEVILKPGEYYVIYCSGEPSLGKNHTSFKLSSSGETVYLAKNGVILDQMVIPGDVNKNESYGRVEGGFAYFPTPTIGKKNNAGVEAMVSVPTASHASGIYGEPITVTLEGAGTIYYTLDGSRPTTASQVYTQPIPITDVTTIRTFRREDDRSSILTAYTYVINKTHDLPIVTLSIPQESLTGEKGVLNNITQNYEYEGVLTLIENGEEKFSVPCGFRLHGNDSRKSDKQNFQLRFRSEYGMGKLHYPVFEDRNIEEYNSLLLKGGSEDWNKAVLRDELACAIVDGNTNLYTQAIKPVVLYLGGEYWGVYYLRERFSDEYVAGHLGVSPESVDIVESTGAYAESGSASSFRALWTYIKNHDMSKTESFEYLAERIDMTSLLDWYICRSYVGDKDLGNIRRFRTSETDGKWYWMWYDLDWAFYHTTDSPLSGIVANGSGDPTLIRAVLESKEGQDALLKRYAELMKTILNDEYFTKTLDGLIASIESEMERDRARWGYSVKSWNSAVEKIRKYTRDGARTKRVLQNLKSYFDLSDAEMVEYFGETYQTYFS